MAKKKYQPTTRPRKDQAKGLFGNTGQAETHILNK